MRSGCPLGSQAKYLFVGNARGGHGQVKAGKRQDKVSAYNFVDNIYKTLFKSKFFYVTSSFIRILVLLNVYGLDIPYSNRIR